MKRNIATIWLHGKKVRVIVRAGNEVIDLCDEWNNVASAEAWIWDKYPDTDVHIGNDGSKALNAEWNSLKLGF